MDLTLWMLPQLSQHHHTSNGAVSAVEAAISHFQEGTAESVGLSDPRPDLSAGYNTAMQTKPSNET